MYSSYALRALAPNPQPMLCSIDTTNARKQPVRVNHSAIPALSHRLHSTDWLTEIATIAKDTLFVASSLWRRRKRIIVRHLRHFGSHDGSAELLGMRREAWQDADDAQTRAGVCLRHYQTGAIATTTAAAAAP